MNPVAQLAAQPRQLLQVPAQTRGNFEHTRRACLLRAHQDIGSLQCCTRLDPWVLRASA